MSNIIIEKPTDFINLELECPSLKFDLAYLSHNNFTGASVPGYLTSTVLCTKTSGQALINAQKKFLEDNLALFIFDSYRPHKSVVYFKESWVLQPDEPNLKQLYYPTKTKQELFTEGFLANYSSHSRGSTFDLSLYSLKENKLLDMGTCFDFFHEKSFTMDKTIPPEAIQNRLYLKEIMEENGFVNYEKEWWHFRFQHEPYTPGVISNFDIS